MKNTILISILLVSLFSCSKTIDFDDQGLSNRLVLNSVIWPDSSFVAYLSKSTSILTNNQVGKVTGGTLDLYENGILIKQLSTTTGVFSEPNFKPKSGSTYKVVASSGGQQIEAETIIPNKAVVISVDTATIRDQNNMKKLNYTVKIKDQEGEDFYRIVSTIETLVLEYNVDRKGKNRYILVKSLNDLTSKDPIFNSLFNNFGGETLNMGPENTDKIFPDDYFQNKTYSINFSDYSNSSYYSQDYFYQDPNNPKNYSGRKCIYEKTTVHVLKLSKDLYTYMKYLNLYNYYHDDPTAEPVPVFSNIKNGVGIFASFNDDAKVTLDKIRVPYSMDTIKVETIQDTGNGGYGGFSE